MLIFLLNNSRFAEITIRNLVVFKTI